MKKLFTLTAIAFGLTAFGQNIPDSIRVIGGNPYKIVPGTQNQIDTSIVRSMYNQGVRDSVAFDGEKQMWIDNGKAIRKRLRGYRNVMQQLNMPY